MKKQTLREEILNLGAELDKERRDHAMSRARLRDLTAEVEKMRAHWRPVPMTHPWQPRNPQCALCDEPRDAPRHQPSSATPSELI